MRELVLADRRVRGIHLSSWGAGSQKIRRELIRKISGTVINAVVIAVKETDGKVYMPGVEKAHKWGSYVPAIAQPEAMLKDFKDAGLYTMARIVVFKDKIIPKIRPDLAVTNPGGDLWRSRNGATWVDPYNREVWDYVLDLAELSAKLGFDEIQFDYIRYPSEGNTALCRYAKPHSRQAAIQNLGEFLRYAHKRLEPYKVKLSVDVFGLTTSVKDDMGIGQDIKVLAANSDYVYPMMYPSHYAPGEYNIPNPTASPYKVINRGLKDAMLKLGPDYAKMRPYLQDFWRYGPADVRAQIIATRLNLLESWVLWNPSNNYTWAAITPQAYRSLVDPEYK
ncbi:MAG: hypothetical protein A2234_11450 [Elusimicrobia bacterium RIFOXYA2_FULL_58_8]|nr:MAG: hypothetical protein A2285_10810 [Elusimicrobia bacterium RIFOXYA12_FULL_57_11]OGS14376.1 MAG: hypothetical protein A2234_11450 [Elusimicrobia bacterium RIFOXYA2_FULL_58_8]